MKRNVIIVRFVNPATIAITTKRMQILSRGLEKRYVIETRLRFCNVGRCLLSRYGHRKQ